MAEVTNADTDQPQADYEDIAFVPFTSFDELKGEPPKQGMAKFNAALNNIFKWRPDLIRFRQKLRFHPASKGNQLLIRIEGIPMPAQTGLYPNSPQGDFEKILGAYLTILDLNETQYDPINLKQKINWAKELIANRRADIIREDPNHMEACQQYAQQLLDVLTVQEKDANKEAEHQKRLRE